MINNKPDITTFADTSDHIKKSVSSGARCLIIEDDQLSIRKRNRYNLNHIDYDRLDKLIDTIREINQNLDIIFNIDIVIHNKHIQILDKLFNFLLNRRITKIRALDTGIANIIRLRYPELFIQLNTETGNNNYESIRFWKKTLGKQLEKIVLSKELDYKQIKNISSKINIKKEIQIHGYIMLLYTKRRVLKGLNLESNQDIIEKNIIELKRPDDNFPIIENKHGSYLLHSKLINLLEELPLIIDLGIDSVLIDMRGHDADSLSQTVYIYNEAFEFIKNNKYYDLSSLKEKIPNIGMEYTKGFFMNNNTDKESINKAKYNINIDSKINEEYQYIGEIIDIVKEKTIGVNIIKSISIGDKIYIDTPEGKFIKITIRFIRDFFGNDLKETKNNGMYIINWSKGLVRKAKLYKEIYG